MLNKVFDTETLKEADIDATRRAETLSFEEWLELFRKSHKKWKRLVTPANTDIPTSEVEQKNLWL